MLTCKNQKIFNLFKNFYSYLNEKLSYDDIIDFCYSHKLTFLIINYKNDDSLYLCTEEGSCYIAENGEIEIGNGNYSIFLNSDDILSKIKQDNINIEKKQVKLKDLFPIDIEKINKNYYNPPKIVYHSTEDGN